MMIMNSKYILKGFWLACLTIGFAACQSDEIETTATTSEVEAGETGITLTGIIGSNVQTRATIVLGNDDEGSETFMWNSDDIIYVKDLGPDGTDTEGAVYEFAISGYSESKGGTTGYFVASDGEEVDFEEGDVLYALYLGSVDEEDEDLTAEERYTTSLEVSEIGFLQFKTLSDSEVEEYMNNNMFMYAKGKYKPNNTTLEFQHLTSLIRVSYTNSTDESLTVKNLGLYGNDDTDMFGWSMELDEVGGNNVVTGDWIFSSTYSNLTIAAGKTVDFYTLFFPTGLEFSDGSFLEILSGGESLYFKTSDITATNKFEAGFRYWFNIEMTDNGLQWTDYEMSSFDEYYTIEKSKNRGLAKALAAVVIGGYLDDSGNAKLPKVVVDSATELDLGDYELSTLDGLEIFTSLKRLYCDNCGLTSIDVSSFENLTYLYCNDNDLTSLDVTNNPSLTQLRCSENKITTLDLSNNTFLYSLYCNDNNLISLDLSNNPKMRSLYCSNNPELTTLICSDARVSTLDIEGDTALQTLKVDGNLLSSLDVTEITDLRELTCGNQYETKSTYFPDENVSQTLTLTLTAAQNELWASVWSTYEANSNVELYVGADVEEEVEKETEEEE